MTNSKNNQRDKKFSYLANQDGQKEQPSTPWKARLDKNVAGAQSNAEDFTKQFMQDMFGSEQQQSQQVQQQQLLQQQKQSQLMQQQQSQLMQQQQQNQLVQQQQQNQLLQTQQTAVSSSQHTAVDEHYEEMMQYAEQHRMHEDQRVHFEESNPPALPPKTKIMFSPSRHLFSPSESVDDSDTTSVNTVEYVPVKEKAKMIAQQQEEILKREEMRKKTGGDGPAGGVRILPPSPVTVKKEFNHQEMHQQQHRVHFQTDEIDMRQERVSQKQNKQVQQNKQSQLMQHQQEEAQQSQLMQQQQQQAQQSQVMQQQQQQAQQSQLMQQQQQQAQQSQLMQQQAQQSQLMQQQAKQSQLMQQQQKAQQSQLMQQQAQQSKQSAVEKSDSRSSQISSADEVMYEATAQVTSSTNTAQVVTMSQQQSSHTATEQQQQTNSRMIPRLEDKYEISAGLDELVAQETVSEAASFTSVSSKVTHQSNYSSMSTTSSATVKAQQLTGNSETSSVKTMRDSSYSTSSSVTSGGAQQLTHQPQLSSENSALRGGNVNEVRKQVTAK